MLHVLLVISLLETTTASLVCLYCTDAVAPADCGTVTRCGPHEHCYVDTYVSGAGSIRYNLGCRDKNKCNSSPNVLGKRKLVPDFSQTNKTEAEVDMKKIGDIDIYRINEELSSGITNSGSKKRAGGFLACSECCNDNMCTNNGCGNNGYSTPRGPICYQCDEQNDPEDCSKIRLCGQGEVCILQKVLNPMSHAVRYTTKCIGENKCLGEIQRYRELQALLVGKRRTVSKRNSLEIDGSCIVQCCKSDLCNINCNDNMPSKPTIAPVASTSIATSQTSTLSSPTTTSYNNPHTSRVLSTYATPEPPTKTSTTSQLFTTRGPASFCLYKSKLYSQGDVWKDGCHYNCTCENATIGFYRCQDVCPVWKNLPAGCTLKKQPGQCCSKPYCGGTTVQPGGTANTCVHRGKYYHEGEIWRDGCQYKCTCHDGKTGRYECQPLCFIWNLPQRCHLDPAPVGKCCQVPVCPSDVVIQYPPGYVQE